MYRFDPFGFYRFALTILAGSYTTVRLVTFIWWWSGFNGQAPLESAVLRRYVIVLLLRTRLRRFLYELTVIGGLTAVLLLLIDLHRR